MLFGWCQKNSFTREQDQRTILANDLVATTTIIVKLKGARDSERILKVNYFSALLMSDCPLEYLWKVLKISLLLLSSISANLSEADQK